MPAAGMGAADPVLTEIASLREAGAAVVLVHGGGPEIDAALTQRGIVTKRIDGMRVTDAVTLEVTEAVLCGSVNKRLVRDALALGIPAVGLSGQDGNLLVAERTGGLRGEDLGYVGRIVATDASPLRALLDAGFVPVVAPLAISRDGAHAYNVNADLGGRGDRLGAAGRRIRRDYERAARLPRSRRPCLRHGPADFGRGAGIRGQRRVPLEHETEDRERGLRSPQRRDGGLHLLGETQRDLSGNRRRRHRCHTERSRSVTTR